MKLVKRVSLALAASLLLAGTAFAQTKDAALEKLAADWTAAYAKADAKALAALYTDDAIRVNSVTGRSIGRAAIEKEFSTNFAGPWKGTKIKITVGETRAVSADVAVNEGTWEISGVRGPDGKFAPNITGVYVNTLLKKNGAWLLASNTAFNPPPPPAKK